MVLWTWLKFILKLFVVRDKDTGKPRLIMGNAISTVTNLAGVHGNSVAIAIGVSVGVMLCVAAFMFYQYRKLQKKVNRLMLANPEAVFCKTWKDEPPVLPELSLPSEPTTSKQQPSTGPSKKPRRSPRRIKSQSKSQL